MNSSAVYLLVASTRFRLPGFAWNAARAWSRTVIPFSLLSWCLSWLTFAADEPIPTPPPPPQVLMCVPLGGIPNQTMKMKARGLRLEGTTDVRSNTAGVNVKFLSQTKATVPASLNAKQAGDTQIEFELTLDDKIFAETETELVFIAPHGQSVYRLPIGLSSQTVLEVEPNAGFKQSQRIRVSQIVLGQIDRPQDVDVYSAELIANQKLQIVIEAASHGSSLDALLSLTDSNGTPLCVNDDHSGSRDSQLEYLIPKSGQYFIVVQDANDLGGEAQPYRLSLREVLPPVSFVRDIAPILQQRCVACHTARRAEGGYRLDTFANLTAEGESGVRGFVAHCLDKSESYRRIVTSDLSQRMPLDGEPLSERQVVLIRQWLEQGAHFDGDKPTAALISQMPPTNHPQASVHYVAPTPITAIAFSPSGNELFASGYHEITVWNPADGSLLRRIGQVAERTYKIAFHPSADEFAVASGNPGELGEVRLFNEQGELKKVIAISADVIHDIAYSPTGDRLAVAGSDATIRVFDLTSHELLRELTGHLDWVLAVAWSPDGSKLASASRDKTAKVFRLETGGLLATYARHQASVRGVLFHPSGEEVYSSGANQRWERWKIDESKHVRDLHLGGEAFKLIGSGNYFLAPSANNRIHLMKAQESDRVREMQGSGPGRFLCVTASESTDRIAAGTQQGDIVVWEFSTGKKLAEFPARP